MHKWLLSLILGISLLVPTAIADGHEDEPEDEESEDEFNGLPDSAKFGICTAYGANEQGRKMSGQNRGNESEENETGGLGAGGAEPFAWLENEASANNQTVEEYCADAAPPGPPEGTPGGVPDGTPTGPPEGTPTGPPEGTPSGPPEGTPSGLPDGIPSGPPSGLPGGPPSGTPDGRP